MLNNNEKNSVQNAFGSKQGLFESMPDSTLLDQRQAAAFLRLSEHALQSWRTTGRYGLPYTKSGRKVFYKLGSLRAFLEERTRTHTGQGG